jgi:hypothetical protein
MRIFGSILPGYNFLVFCLNPVAFAAKFSPFYYAIQQRFLNFFYL